MTNHFDVMIPGASSAGDPKTVRAPFDRSEIATVAPAGSAAVEQALATAYDLYRDSDRWLHPTKRIEVLERAAAIMKERREELALEAAREGGKPLTDSLVEADRAIDGMKCCVETLRTQAGEEITMGVTASSSNRWAFTRLEPIGPVLAFSAFNHPLNLIVHQVGPAIAAGCPVLVKPAEATPLSCFRFVEILREAGLADEWCQAFIVENHDVSGKLVSDPRVGFFTFIGSGNVGWMLRSQLAAGTRCALEHGGVAPVIVAADADFDDCLPLLAKGGFYHAGQVCVSVQRVFVERSHAREFADRLAALAQDLTVGDPTSAETEVGPMIRPAEVTRVHEWIQEGQASRGELLCGGKALSETTFAPTVLFDPPADVRVSTHEVFGPVVCVYPYDALDDAIARSNALPYAFQSAVFTRNIDMAVRAATRFSAAAVMINDHTAFRVDWMPFAGLKESGHGVGGIPYTMHDMQVKKLIVIRSQQAWP